jgi:formylglycine-generating enzyme required for sulfatase activity/serine/threonine protein kinase
MVFKPGQRILNGEYTIKRLLGKGGFGQVYYVTSTTSAGLSYAMKVLHPDTHGGESEEFQFTLARFRQEASLQRTIHHQNIIHVAFDRQPEEGADAGAFYLFMDYAGGGNLAQRLRDHGPMPVDAVVEMALHLCAGLEEIHRRGVVHRDLKPSNILFDDTGVARIADLGLAQSREGPSGDRDALGSKATEHPGTRSYMSPEQAHTKGFLSPSSDIYSLGCVLFESLTNKMYYTYRGERVSRLLASAPAWLDEVIERAVCERPGKDGIDDKDGTARYPTADVMARDLKEGRRQGWFEQAWELVLSDPDRALELVKRIESEEKYYPGLNDLREMAEAEQAHRQQLKEWFHRAQKCALPRPEECLELLNQIEGEHSGYPGVSRLRKTALEALEKKKKEHLRARFEEACALVEREPEKCLQIVSEIEEEEQAYEGLTDLRDRAQAAIARQARLAAWYREACERVGSDPEGALELADQIEKTERAYPGLEDLRRQIDHARIARERLRLICALRQIGEDRHERLEALCAGLYRALEAGADLDRVTRKIERIEALDRDFDGLPGLREAVRSARLARDFEAARQMVASDPERAMDMLLAILNTASDYPGLSQLWDEAEVAIETRERLAKEAEERARRVRVQGDRMWVKLADGVEMELARVRAGEFPMGSDPKRDSLAAHGGEQPQHRVHLDEYWMGRYPVTNAQYQAFVAATGKGAPSHWSKGNIPKGKETHPVVNVSWADAAAFCEWASGAAEVEIRLPTEAEWEKAARGTDGRIYPWGDKKPDKGLCNFSMNVKDATPAGQYSPAGDSPYGCADMAGNVWEWVSDWYDGDYYKNSSRENPAGPATGEYRVLRGGSWDFYVRGVRSASRGRNFPDFRYDDVGFRCARSQ